MTIKNKNILKTSLKLLFILVSLIVLSTPIIRMYVETNNHTHSYNANVFSVLCAFGNPDNPALIPVISLFIIILTITTLCSLIVTLVSLLLDNKQLYKVFNIISIVLFSLLLFFYLDFIIGMFLIPNTLVLNGIYTIMIFLVISIIIYLCVSIFVKVKEEEKDSLVFCPNCGKKITTDSKFCNECGINIVEETICSNCGAHLDKDDNFCTRCGKKIK